MQMVTGNNEQPVTSLNVKQPRLACCDAVVTGNNEQPVTSPNVKQPRLPCCDADGNRR